MTIKEDNVAIAAQLRAARIAAGIGQEAVAQRLGISRTYLSRLERGERVISASMLMRLPPEIKGRMKFYDSLTALDTEVR
jgi:transcriptional regulator with XRE-family HTH domain